MHPIVQRVSIPEMAKSFPAPIMMVPHVRKLLISSVRDFLEIHTFEKEHLNRLPLRVWKRRECFGCKPARLLQLETAWRPRACRLVHSAYLSLAVHLPDPSTVPLISA